MSTDPKRGPKPETQRERAEFAAQCRVFSPKDPPLLTTEAINDVCAVLHEDAKTRRRVRQYLYGVIADGPPIGTLVVVQNVLHALGDE